jgi:hypothetical protein
MMVNSSQFKLIRYVGLVGIVLLLSNVHAWPPKDKSEAINTWTNSFFYNLHPEMENRKIQKHQVLYKQEWLAIQNVIRVNLSWGSGCDEMYDDEPAGTYAGYYFLGSTAKLADAVFYVRHPELKGRKIRSYETHLKKEWNDIKESFFWSC